MKRTKEQAAEAASMKTQDSAVNCSGLPTNGHAGPRTADGAPLSARPLSTRRRFFLKAGAALSAPLAFGATNASAVEAGDDAGRLKSRLAELEDVEAIRALIRAHARLVSSGPREALAELFADPSADELEAGLRSLSPDHFGERDIIEIAADGQRATARIHCVAEIEAAIEPRCPLVDMAREQGGGIVRRTESAVLENSYVKRGGVWKIERSVYRSA
jgi:hypothetical protein